MTYDFPQHRTSNEGRLVTINRKGDVNTLVFIYQDEEVAELHPPEEGAPLRSDGLSEWSLTFEAYPETTVLGPADEAPLDGALFYVDQALDYLEGDS